MEERPSLWSTPRWSEGGKVAALAGEMTAIGSALEHDDLGRVRFDRSRSGVAVAVQNASEK